MTHGDAREGKWRGNWRIEWVASTLHTTSEHDVSSINTADAHTSAASSRLNWRPHRFKLTRPFRRKTKSGFCACAITFPLASSAAGLSDWLSCWRGFVIFVRLVQTLGIELCVYLTSAAEDTFLVVDRTDISCKGYRFQTRKIIKYCTISHYSDCKLPEC
jgi:hypothetical protein